MRLLVFLPHLCMYTSESHTHCRQHSTGTTQKLLIGTPNIHLGTPAFFVLLAIALGIYNVLLFDSTYLGEVRSWYLSTVYSSQNFVMIFDSLQLSLIEHLRHSLYFNSISSSHSGSNSCIYYLYHNDIILVKNQLFPKSQF
jgi:hypothetical protein